MKCTEEYLCTENHVLVPKNVHKWTKRWCATTSLRQKTVHLLSGKKKFQEQWLEKKGHNEAS